MYYFKNSEIAETYHVSVKTVSNWINAAKNGKLNISLYDVENKSYVANTARNMAILKNLAQERRKYRNTRSYKEITPTPEFYELFSRRQVVAIINSLELHRELPRQFTYMGDGAEAWNKYSIKLANSSQRDNSLLNTIELLRENHTAISTILQDYDKIDVVDLGVGNAIPVKDLLDRLLRQDSLGRYVAVDVSSSMIEIAKRNIAKWFGGKIDFVSEVKDITYDRMDEILATNIYRSPSDCKIANLILLLGGTINNSMSTENTLRMIRSGMSANDIFVTAFKLDTPNSRRYFDYNVGPEIRKLSSMYDNIFNLMNLFKVDFALEADYDPIKRMRYERIRLNEDLSIKFICDKREHIVNFNKNDTILLLRIWHKSSIELLNEFDRCGLEILHAAITNDGEYLLQVHRVKQEKF